MRLGKRERAALRQKQAANRAASCRASHDNGVVIRTSMASLWPAGKPSRAWGWDGQTQRRVRRENK